MIAADVMTRNVISIAPDATIQDAINLMLSEHSSGALVVDENGDLVGIITDGDLLRRYELGTERNRSWWQRLVASPAQQAADFTQANGRRVRDVMTQDVVSVGQDAPLEDVVDAMEKHHIKRLPVTLDGRVVGVVSRTELLQALISPSDGGEMPVLDDQSVHRAILDMLKAQPWAPLTTLNVAVVNGVVDLSGTVTNEEERHGIRVIAENSKGVKAVRDHLVFVEPYTGTVIDAPDTQAR